VNYTFAWTATPSASTVVADATLGTTTASTLAVGTIAYSVLITNPINGCFKTDNVSVTIDPTTVAGTTTGALAEVCNGSGTSLSLAGNTGTIQWSSSANATGPFTNIASENGSSLNTGNLSSTQYYLATVTSGVCPSQGSNIVGVVVSPTTVAGTISAPTALCYDANTSAVLSGSVGSIVWQSSADDVTYTTIAG